MSARAARGAGWPGALREGPWRQSLVMAGLGAGAGLALLLVRGVLRIPATVTETLFTIVHPAHVFVAAATMARMLNRDGRFPALSAAAISYALAMVIVTVTDSLLPYVAEWLLALPSRHVHVGFVEIWWLVHPLAIAGVAAGLAAPRLRLRPPLVLAASVLPPLFDMMMAMWRPLDPAAVITIAVFTGLSVWAYLLGMAVVVAVLVHGTGSSARLTTAMAPCLEAVRSGTDIDLGRKQWYPHH